MIFAHPDDAEFTAGGTLAKWALAGDQIYYVVCTDGSKGSKGEEQIGAWNRTLGESKGFTFAEAFKILRPHCEICR